MMELIRNCSHGSEIATYLAGKDSLGRHVIKAASTPEGIKNLKNEVKGWNWYQGIRYEKNREPICRIIREAKNYLRIQIDFIEGDKIDYAGGLEKNANMVRRVFGHYRNIFPYHSGALSAFHGDFSLDNVILNSSGIHIIDWEHFNPNGAPWGFDALYLLFETLYFGMRKRKTPSRNEIDLVIDNINYLNTDNRLEQQMIEHPLKFVKSFIENNSGLWSGQLAAFPDKFPVLKFTDDQVDLIDDMIFPNLRSGKK